MARAYPTVFNVVGRLSIAAVIEFGNAVCEEGTESESGGVNIIRAHGRPRCVVLNGP